MKLKLFLAASAVLFSGALLAAADGALENADINVNDQASLQRGASLYVNYCLGCHSLQYMRYNRLVQDLGLSEEQVESFMLYGDQELADDMVHTMDSQQATEWFGIMPPDLTLTARSRGVNWIYTYMKSFYLTDQGWNNTVLENTSMPHILWELQGIQRAVTESHTDAEGMEHVEVVGLELDEPGTLSPAEYDARVRDLAAFMRYAAEPSMLKREAMGIWVLLFLVVLTGLSWLLYQEYWKDVK